MSLQGTGNATEYWSGTGPFTGSSNRPFTIALWALSTAADGTSAVETYVNYKGSDWYLVEANDAAGSVGYYVGRDAAFGNEVDVKTTGSLLPNTWYFIVYTLGALSATDSITLNAGTPVTATASSSSDSALDTLCICGGNNPTTVYTMLAEISIWKGMLSATDIGKLYNGGAGGLGVYPPSLVSTSGATLSRYYLPNAHNTSGSGNFADFSGNSGATLAAQGRATPTWNANNPPVNAAATNTVTSAPLITCMW